MTTKTKKILFEKQIELVQDKILQLQNEAKILFNNFNPDQCVQLKNGFISQLNVLYSTKPMVGVNVALNNVQHYENLKRNLIDSVERYIVLLNFL
jgi:hypothetical protein